MRDSKGTAVSPRSSVRVLMAVVLMAVGAGGCSLGPRYVKPQPVVASSFVEANADTYTPDHPPASPVQLSGLPPA